MNCKSSCITKPQNMDNPDCTKMKQQIEELGKKTEIKKAINFLIDENEKLIEKIAQLENRLFILEQGA